mgnify:CR=1 FL=1
MKYALKNAVILDGTKDMEPLRGQSVLVEGETIVGLVPAGSEPMGFEPVDLTGKSVVLVDDIITTGATLEEASRTLKNAGAASVVAAAVAKTTHQNKQTKEEAL